MLNVADRMHLDRLREETLELLALHVGREREIIYLDVPWHRNLGDTLIWAGARDYFTELRNRIIWQSAIGRYRDDDIIRLASDAVIVINGGGNLGDLYPAHEEFRQHIVRRWSTRRIVVLPQSCHFARPDAAAAAMAGYRRASDLTVLLREQRSLRWFEENAQGVRSAFCYDTALGARMRPANAGAGTDVVVIGRSDAEQTAADVAAASGLKFPDWHFTMGNDAQWGIARLMGRVAKRLPNPLVGIRAGLLRGALSLALDSNRKAGGDQLTVARALATNRLRAHILACMLGVPHFVSDNSYGKTSAVFDGYTGAFSTARWAESLADAVASARAFAGREESTGSA